MLRIFVCTFQTLNLQDAAFIRGNTVIDLTAWATYPHPKCRYPGPPPAAYLPRFPILKLVQLSFTLPPNVYIAEKATN